MFGRPARDTGLAAERNNQPTDRQRLHLLLVLRVLEHAADEVADGAAAGREAEEGKHEDEQERAGEARRQAPRGERQQDQDEQERRADQAR